VCVGGVEYSGAYLIHENDSSTTQRGSDFVLNLAFVHVVLRQLNAAAAGLHMC